LKKLGVAETRIVEIGSLTYDHKVEAQRNNSLFNKHRTSTGKPRVVFCTALANYGLSVCQVNLMKHRKNFLDIASLALRRTDIDFFIKTHPRYDYYEFYKELQNRTNHHLKIHTESDVNSVLSKKAIAVLVNIPSSVFLNIIAAGIPIIYFKSASHDLPILKSALDRDDAIRPNNIEELEDVIDRIIKDGNFRKIVLDRNLRLLHSNIANSRDAAISKLSGFIDHLLCDHPQFKEHQDAERILQQFRLVLTAQNRFSDSITKKTPPPLTNARTCENTDSTVPNQILGALSIHGAIRCYRRGDFPLTVKLLCSAILTNPGITKNFILWLIGKIYYDITL
jgi:hypothetical protein